jgi:uncharacterized protein (UPF0335 family)
MTEIIQSLESNLAKLFSKLQRLENENQTLKQELKISTEKSNHQGLEIQGLKKDLETLKLANALLGSDENKRETKLKINSLIREIDYCIAQLSE